MKIVFCVIKKLKMKKFVFLFFIIIVVMFIVFFCNKKDDGVIFVFVRDRGEEVFVFVVIIEEYL